MGVHYVEFIFNLPRLYLVLALLWVLLSLCVRIMTTFSVEMWHSDTVIVWSNGTNREVV